MYVCGWKGEDGQMVYVNEVNIFCEASEFSSINMISEMVNTLPPFNVEFHTSDKNLTINNTQNIRIGFVLLK